MIAKPTVTLVDDDALKKWVRAECGLFICTAGYEDRALKAAATIGRPTHAAVRVIRLIDGDAANDEAFAKAAVIFGSLQDSEVICYSVRRIADGGSELLAKISQILVPKDKQIMIDVSGLPAHGICQSLYAVRSVFPVHRIVCVYTAAKEYYPTEREYRANVSKRGVLNSVALPDSLTYEVADNVVLNTFPGYPIRHDQTCLFLFAGFEKHRSVAAIESCNPARLVVIYAKSAEPKLYWREDLSRQLHADLFATVSRAEEALLTTQVAEMCDLLDEYYSMLYDDMAVVLAPINSKLHTIACFLFWERFRDVQISFPIPVRYLPARSSKGVGSMYLVELPATPQVAAFLDLR
jgi:hypothetical protein